MDELHEQTVNLLSFQQLPKAVFDAQVAFNLIDRYGEKSLSPLNVIESRIQRHFHGLVSDQVIVPSLDASASAHLPRSCLLAVP